MKNLLEFQGITFSDRQIRAGQAAANASLDGRVMEVDTAELTVQTGAEIYGLVSSDGYPLITSDGYRLAVSQSFVLSDWSQAQPVTLYRGGSQFARWYPRTLRRLGGDLYAISATSALGFLTQTEHRGGVYSGDEAGGVIRAICGGVEVYVSPVFEKIKLYGYLPYVSPSGLKNAVKGSAKDNLLRVLFALGAMLRVDASGTLRVENLPAEVSSVIGRDRIYKTGFSVEDETPVTSLTVLEHQYTPGAGGGKTTLFEGITEANQVIVFRDPMSALEATGFSVLESGANYAVVSAGTGTLTGTPYIHTTREVTRAVSESDTENLVRIEDATLVGITNSGDVAARMAEYYKHRKRIHVDATVEFERPGDVVSVYDPVARVMREACLEKLSPLNVSHTMKGRLSALVGFTPWQTVPFQDRHELLTESGTWTAPDNLLPGTTVTAILISGGDGGVDGEDGGNGKGYFWGSKTFRPGETGTYEAPGGVGGAGGKGGAPGNGGRILRVTLTVDPGQRFTVAIGRGGAANGGLGGVTKFGEYSSADGEPSASGFVDPITGDAYASPGDPGLDGGAGASGGSAGRNGSAGQDAGAYTGGRGGSGYSSNLDIDDVEIGGGGGSGASAIGNGAPGGNGTFEGGGTTVGTLISSGGAGIPGGTREAPTAFGAGGHGGHGGSGGGGAGAARYRLKSGFDVPVGVYLSCNIGYGGDGGLSSAGVQGCIVLFYRVPIEE